MIRGVLQLGPALLLVRTTRPLIAAWLVGCWICATAQSLAADEFAIGADVSFLADAEARGVVFKDRGVARPGLEILHERGYNWIRLRIFHTPRELPNNLEYTLAVAREAKARGFKLLLDFHYSDTWADPEKQFTPRAWRALSHPQLVDAVFEYTRDTIAAFVAADATPDMVQIGNEVISGMLWPDGRLPEHWGNFADLVKAGIRGVDAGVVTADGRAAATRPRIMIHIDRGGDQAATKFFFDQCLRYGIEFDVIGQSFYPWWHGSLDDLSANFEFMANEYDKDIVLVEVAYHWRRAEYRNKPGPFPETPAGQRDFLAAVTQLTRQTPHGRGKGVFWWEPAVGPGPLAGRGMFDESGNALPVLSLFEKPIRVASPETSK